MYPKYFSPWTFSTLVVALATAALVAASVCVNLCVLHFEYFCNHSNH